MFSVLELYPILIPREFSLSFPPWFLFSDNVMGTPLASCLLLPATLYVGTVPSIAVLLVFIAFGDPSIVPHGGRVCPSLFLGMY